MFITTAILAPVFLPSIGRPWSEEEEAQRIVLERYYASVIDGHTDLEAMVWIAAYAARLAEGDEARFMWLMDGLILDAPLTPAADWLSILTGPWSRARHRIHARWPWMPGSFAPARFGSAGFHADDGSNQVQHVWYSVAVAYHWGASLADGMARYHEWNAPGPFHYLPGTGGGHGSEADLVLSRQGIALGRALAEGRLSPGQVPGWLRDRLGPAPRKGASSSRSAYMRFTRNTRE